MATVTQRYVNTDPANTTGGTGKTNLTTGVDRAYVSMAAWHNAEATDISSATGNDTIAQVDCSGSDIDVAWIDFTGWTTSSTNYLNIRAMGAARCNGSSRDIDSNIYQHNGFFEFYEDHIRFEGIDFARATTKMFEDITTTSDSDIRFTDCAFRTHTAGGTSVSCILMSKAGTNVTITNCLLAVRGRGIYTLGSASATVDHCTVYSNGGGQYGVLCDPSDTVTNTYAGAFSVEDFYTAGAAVSGSHNASDDTTGNTDFTNSLDFKAPGDQFTSPSLTPASSDFTLKEGNVLAGAGTGSLTNDIAGNAYPSPSDIGCFSSGAGGGPTGINVLRLRINGY